MELSALLLPAALVFAVINGLNDGAALIAVGMRAPGLRPYQVMGALAAALVAGPLLVGAGVAVTFAARLVPYGQGEGAAALLVAVVSAVGVAALLSSRGLPTSLTLALVGAVAGSGLGYGLPVRWSAFAAVLAIGAVAPLLGGVVAWGIISLAGRLRSARLNRFVTVAHLTGFGAQSFAYAANDGQKMLAVYAVATGGMTDGRITFGLVDLAVLSAFFTIGMVLGLRRVATTLSDDILLVRPPQAAAAELSSAGAVLTSAAAGAPVSMTQALVGGLVGAGMSESYLQIRWRAAGALLLAWVITLPASMFAAAVVARGVRAWT